MNKIVPEEHCIQSQIILQNQVINYNDIGSKQKCKLMGQKNTI